VREQEGMPTAKSMHVLFVLVQLNHDFGCPDNVTSNDRLFSEGLIGKYGLT
jgi:hypothetical protein